MITVAQALDLLNEYVLPLESETIPLLDARNKVLAESVSSKIDMPPFDQSAMDGYGIHYGQDITDYRLIGEVPAGGKFKHFDLQPGEAVRIFTGSPVPSGVNIVVKQEIAVANEQTVSFTDPIKLGQNIRPKGEQIGTGQLALEAGTKLSAASIGFLVGLGITEVPVSKSPQIAILVTGDELTKPGRPLEEGKIYESNSFMLEEALSAEGYQPSPSIHVPDTFEATKAAIEMALEQHNVLVLSGGISVGDYDFVGKALSDLGAKEIFYKVKQKPGKPLYFGKIGDKYIFALPGNPAAALTAFHMYVRKALDAMQGKLATGCTAIEMALSADYIKKSDRAEFLKAKVQGGEVTVLDHQSSAMLRSFSNANALVYLSGDKATFSKGSAVTTYLL